MAGMMIGKGRRLLATIGLTGAILLGGCAYDDGYGYSGVSVGSGYYGGGYYDGYGGSYYPGSYGGWYNDFYYPGSGYYVYDRGGRRHRWNNGQRSYWEGRRSEWRGRDNAGRGAGRGAERGAERGNGRGNGRREGWWNGRRNGAPTTTTPSVPGRQWQGRPRPDGVTNGNRQGWRADRRSGQSVGQPGVQRPQRSIQRDAPRTRSDGVRGRNGAPRTQPN